MNDFIQVSPESMGISSAHILDFIKRTREACIEMHSFSVMRHDKILSQGWWKPYNPDTPHIMFSFSKSLTSTAIGFLVQEGKVTLDEKLADIFPEFMPENPSENLLKADVFSLLTMSCGHKDEINGDEQFAPDWIRHFLAHEFTYEPGTTFQYNTPGTNMLSAIVTKKTGLPLMEYLKPRLLTPLGMSDVKCVKLPDGTDFGGAGMYLTLKDMQLFGSFLLHRGVFNGQRLLNDEWFTLASEKEIETISEVYNTDSDNWRMGYGFQFWRNTYPNSFRADGAYGQFDLIFPEKDMIITLNTASFYTNDLLHIVFDTIMKEVSDEALPEDPAVYAKLQETLESLTVEPLWGVRNKDSEKKYSGLTYTTLGETKSFTDLCAGSGRFYEDHQSLKSLTFDFSDSSLLLHVVQSDLDETLEIPLNGKFSLQQFAGEAYGCSGRWENGHKLLVEVRHVRSVAGARLSFRFDESGVNVSRRSTMPTDDQMLLDGKGGTIRLFCR